LVEPAVVVTMADGQGSWPRVIRVLPVVAWAAYVLVASVVDPGGTGLPATGPLGLVGVDKWLHAGSYATVAFLLALGVSARTRRQLAVVCVATIAFGAGVELLQAPLAARSADVLDAAANAVGAILGVGVWTATRRFRDARAGSSADSGPG
jgi:VanZ family protein